MNRPSDTQNEQGQQAAENGAAGTRASKKENPLQKMLDSIMLDIKHQIQDENGTTGQPLTDEEKQLLQQSGEILVNNFTGFIQAYREAKALFTGVDEWFSHANPGAMSTIGFLFGNIKDLLPELKEEIEVYKRETGQTEINFTDFMRNTDPETYQSIESTFYKILKRAQEKAAAKQNKPLMDLHLFDADYQSLEALSILPKHYVIPSNPISNSLTGRTDKKTGTIIEVVDAGGFDLPVMKAGKPGEVTAYTMIAADETAAIAMTGKKFTEYDRCIMNSVVSLWEAGNTIITPEMVYRTMANRTDTEKVTPQQIGAATKSIEKMRHIFVKANIAEEMQKRNLYAAGERVTGGYIDNYLLQLSGIHVTAGGKVRDAYKIDAEPILLTYSKVTNQLITVPMQLLDIKAVKDGKITGRLISTTEKRQPIKEYLLRRIEVMKHDRKNKKATQSTRILFDTLYRETEIDASKRDATADARNYVFQVLDYWAAGNYIAGYSKETAGRKITGVTIKL